MRALRFARPIFDRTLHRTLVHRRRSTADEGRARFDRAGARRVAARTWEHYERLAADLPAEKTTGSRMNVQFAALTLAFHRSLVDAGVEREYAIELVAEASWRIYAVWGRLAAWLTWPWIRNRRHRMDAMLRLFLRFPFNRPGYEYELPESSRGFATHFRRCPVADYFHSQGEADVCRGTWCTLDYPLAELWGGHFERTQTLSTGDPVCDMLWIAEPTE